MNQDKYKKLAVYATSLKNRLSDPTPKKHVGHPETYSQFLNRELDAVSKQLADAKLLFSEGKK